MCRFIAVHYWHLAVHQDQMEATLFQLLFDGVISYDVKCFLSIFGLMADQFGINCANMFQNDFNCIDIILFVIYNQNLLLNSFNVFLLDQFYLRFLPQVFHWVVVLFSWRWYLRFASERILRKYLWSDILIRLNGI